jgi:hypothetical protein
MDSRFNIPAPAGVKALGDIYPETVCRLKVAVCRKVGRGGFGQSGSVKGGIKKILMLFFRPPVP